MDESILLIGHGSRDLEGVRELTDLLKAIRTVAGSTPDFEAGVLEFPGPLIPSIQEAIARSVARGARRILAVPLLLFAAGHAKHDVPAEIARARLRYPWLDVRVAPPLGVRTELVDIVEERIEQIQCQLPPGPVGDTAILLVGRGTTDAMANGDVFKIGRLLWERRRRDLVECCFAGSTEPGVADGLNRCVRLGARRIVVLPYFINTGILVKRIQTQAHEAQAIYPNVEIAIGAHFGVHPKLVTLLVEQMSDLAGADGRHGRSAEWTGEPVTELNRSVWVAQAPRP